MEKHSTVLLLLPADKRDEWTDTRMPTGALTQIFPANMLTGGKLIYRQMGIDSCTEFATSTIMTHTQSVPSFYLY